MPRQCHDISFLLRHLVSPQAGAPTGKKSILLNAFDIFAPGMLSPGQWNNPADKGLQKFDISFWVEYVKLLEKAACYRITPMNINQGGYDVYGGSMDETIKRATQYPVLDPTIISPIAAMAAPPFLLDRRASTLDHITNGRFGWNIVTGWKKSAFQAIGLDEAIAHDLRYESNITYRLWEGSWANDVVQYVENNTYADPYHVHTIKHEGGLYRITTRHMVPPSPQRTPFLFQAGTSGAGVDFASTHAEAAFVAKLRAALADKGRDPRSLKVFISLCPVLRTTDEEAREKLEGHKKYASVVGRLVQTSGVIGIDLSKASEGEKWTPRRVSEFAAIDEMERWINEADIDGFNLVSVATPQSFEDVVELLVPELRRWGLHAEPGEERLTTGSGWRTWPKCACFI
ncbi:luciferase-like domain-containing protein [Aspergillus carlsbadensis]|nr:luciferase-like domain-containing protein [Aspergillus carlsbadensis]